MRLLAIGLNHKTAPLALREQVATACSVDGDFLHKLLSLPYIYEALVLSTCNRTEIYCCLDVQNHDTFDILNWFSKQAQIEPRLLETNIYQYENIEAVRHLLRVASGLDSMMLGEPQILGQLKQAFRDAYTKSGIKNELGHLFPFVFKATKQIRTESGIGNQSVSVASAAVKLINQTFDDIKQVKVFIIGSGETGGLVAKYLYQKGARDFTIASRTLEHADELALKWDAKASPITDIPSHLPEVDVVISATSCPLPFIDEAMLKKAIGPDRLKTLFLLDLAVPRDIAPDVSNCDYVKLYNIDDLHCTIEKSIKERKDKARYAEQLLFPLVEEYMRNHRIRYANQAICDYRDQMYELAQSELNRAHQKLDFSNANPQDVLNEFSQRLVKKLTHATTVGLRYAAADDRRELIDLAHYLLTLAKPKS